MFWHRLLHDTLFFADAEEYICSLSKCTGIERNNEADKMDMEMADSQGQNAVKFEDDEEASRSSADLGAIKKSFGFDEEGHFLGSTDTLDKRKRQSAVTYIQQTYKPPTVPKTFVSGSTPENLSQRYLKWNRYGTIVSRRKDDDSIIEVNSFFFNKILHVVKDFYYKGELKIIAVLEFVIDRFPSCTGQILAVMIIFIMITITIIIRIIITIISWTIVVIMIPRISRPFRLSVGL
ncbi:unnamed protein product [Gongylonema pulchrum]|uniref:Mcl1_mid domain-containing protein n=1 Tax=Gongylonema pulchrum TaxID=637853 RepID=A0A183EU55_9BILA|nr:unnamed protein product [Gongylonema pulchrum]